MTPCGSNSICAPPTSCSNARLMSVEPNPSQTIVSYWQHNPHQTDRRQPLVPHHSFQCLFYCGLASSLDPDVVNSAVGPHVDDNKTEALFAARDVEPSAVSRQDILDHDDFLQDRRLVLPVPIGDALLFN